MEDLNEYIVRTHAEYQMDGNIYNIYCWEGCGEIDVKTYDDKELSMESLYDMIWPRTKMREIQYLKNVMLYIWHSLGLVTLEN